MGKVLADFVLKGTVADLPTDNTAGTEGRFYAAEDSEELYRDNGTDWDLVANISGGGASTFPNHVTIWQDEAAIVAGNALTLSSNSAQAYYQDIYQAPPANSNSFRHKFFMAAGTYTIYFLGRLSNGNGKLDWSLDGDPAFISGQDWYNASSVPFTVLSTSITVGTDGNHTLTGTINGKNASSANYYHNLVKIWIQ